MAGVQILQRKPPAIIVGFNNWAYVPTVDYLNRLSQQLMQILLCVSYSFRDWEGRNAMPHCIKMASIALKYYYTISTARTHTQLRTLLLSDINNSTNNGAIVLSQ